MFKFIVMIKKRSGMTRQEFIDYYENRHAPLLTSIMPPIGTYRRNYPRYDDELGGAIGRGGAEVETKFDVFTEVIFDTREQADTYMSAFWIPELNAQIVADEAKFVAPGGVRVFVVDCFESPK